MKKHLFLLCGLFGLSLQASYAQSATSSSSGEVIPTHVLTLQESIDYGIKNNLQLKQSALAVKTSDNTYAQSKWLKYPSVNGGTNLSTFTGRNVDPFSNSIVTTAIGTNNFGINASVPIFNGFEIQNTIARNALDLEANRLDYEAIKNSISLQIIISYLGILSSEDQIEVAQKQLEVTRLQFERTNKLVQAGSVPMVNLYDLEAQLANDELQVVNAQNALENAKLTLKQALNMPASETIKVVRVDVPNPAIQPYPQTAQEIYERAIGYLPEVKAAATRIELANKTIEIARAASMPRISLNSGWGTTYSTAAKSVLPGEETFQQVPVSATFEGQTVPFLLNLPQQSFIRENIPYFRQVNNNQNVNLNVSIQIPIFNGYASKYRVQGAQIQKAQATIQAESTQLTIRQNIDQAYINMLNASRRYMATKTQVDALQKSFEVATSRFEAGASNLVDYNLSKTNLDRAMVNLIQAKYDFVFRLKILDFYQNKPLVF